MKYVNQLDYPDLPYYTRVKVEGLTREEMYRTVALSGCGLCCSCMAVDILTDKTLGIEECVRISEDCVANHAVGTDMHVLGPVIGEMFGLDYSSTNELDEAIRHIQAGGVAIALVWCRSEEEPGLFTKRGHYILLVSTDGEEFCILDPAYEPGKFDTPARAGKVNDKNAPYLYCDVNLVHAETKPERTRYFLFKRSKK